MTFTALSRKVPVATAPNQAVILSDVRLALARGGGVIEDSGDGVVENEGDGEGSMVLDGSGIGSDGGGDEA